MPEKPLNVIQNDIDNVLKESETHRRALGGEGGWVRARRKGITSTIAEWRKKL
jgi:hypothetical protein